MSLHDEDTTTTTIGVDTDADDLSPVACDNCSQETASRSETQPVRYLPYPHVSIEQWCNRCRRTIFPWTRRYLPIRGGDA